MATCKDDTQTYSGGSDILYDLICVSCYHDALTKPACGYCMDCREHLCSSCLKDHRRPAPCRNHRLQDQTAMPQSQQLPATLTTTDSGLFDELATPCEHHQNKIVELYCNNHNLLLCHICVALYHKSCNVDYIPDISKSLLHSKDSQDTINSIDKLIKKCKRMKTNILKHTTTSNKSLEKALSDLKKHRQEFNKRMDDLEKEIHDTIRTLKTQNDYQVKSVDTVCQDILNNSKLLQDKIKHMKSFKLSNKLFVEIKQANKLLKEYEDNISTITSQVGSINEYKFVPRQEIQNVLYTQNILGDIENKHTSEDTDNAQLLSLNPTFKDKIHVHTSQDKLTCQITGMTVISLGKLVLCDNSNAYIKLVDINNKKVISQVSLGTGLYDSLWDITSISAELVAVTVPFRHLILFVTVSNNTLKLSHKIKTNGSCHGISYYQDKFIVTYQFPSKLEILDIKGKLIKTISNDTTLVDFISYPVYVEVNSRYINVSVQGKDEIIMLNWNGDIIARCNDMFSPRGLVVLNDDSLLVCDLGANIVYQVSGACKNKKVLLQDVDCPQAVCVDHKQNKLYVSVWRRDQSDNYILVWKI